MVALGFLAKHGISAETAAGGFEALEKVRESVESGRPYDLVFMDHMMPDLDGTEAAKQIRALAEGEDSPYAFMPIVALSANAVKGAEKSFLSSGMNGFVPKPIDSAALNAVLKKFLPEEKYTLEDAENSRTASGEQYQREVRIRNELEKIKGLDLKTGLYYAAENFEIYASTLLQFSADMEKGLAVISKILASGDWRSYAIEVHAYKGICAAIGAEALSEWGKKLEGAAKNGDKPVCFAETEAFCSALTEFNEALRGTSLFAESGREDGTGISVIL
jgi:CheY-like chemotaxis protein/HPt (histidine-containing phosphotransfer) domain-containing protein